MLTLRDSNGEDLIETPPAPYSAALLSQQGTPFTLSVLGVESDTSLAPINLTGAVDWNDGRPSTAFNVVVNGTLAMIDSRMLSVGYHNIGISVQNYRAPVRDVVRTNLSVTIVNTERAPESVRYLYGPILPKDEGYPNANQWNFNSDSNVAVLASSVKMLVSTMIGERIMLPGYGTDLRGLLFEPNIPGLESLIQERVTQALARWEPRVSVVALSIVRGNRDVTLSLTLSSSMSQQQFNVQNTFTAT